MSDESILDAIRKLVDEVLRAMDKEFDGMYAGQVGRRCRRSDC